ncbi:MAG: heavy metal-binding domain-containing protein [Bacteroidales bacterium]|nr:heavy metal-binding domain-containing protein [Bacteroidales bacterium]
MKKILVIVAMGIAMVLFAGCTGYNRMTYNTMNQTKVVLDKANFEVIGQVEGVYSTEYIFGIGGHTKAAMRENAAQQMYKNANLRGSQAIINVTYSTSHRTILGVYSEYTVTAYGTVIEFK